MASKLDFNAILAKADKNSTNAQKLLEEKKLNQKRIEEKKKEEIRLRNEREAFELLKRKRLESLKQNTATQNPKPAPALVKSAQPAKPSVAPTNKPASTNINKPETSKSRSASTPANNKSKTVPSNPQTKNKPESSNANSKTANKSKPVAVPSKPKLSYEEMLRLADENQKNKSLSSASQKPAIISSMPPQTEKLSFKPTQSNKTVEKKQEAASKPNSSAKPNGISQKKPAPAPNGTNGLVSKLTPEQILKLKQKDARPNVATSLNKPSTAPQPIRPSTSASSLNKKPQTKENSSNLSAWDRIVSDMKKKPVKKSDKGKNNAESDQELDDEDEYDSEMDDFIADDDEDVDQEHAKIYNEQYSTEIRKLFKYNPNKYKHLDEEDIDNMETDYHSQLREEHMSSRIALMEDMEEERRELEMERRRKEKLSKRKSDNGREDDKKKFKK